MKEWYSTTELSGIDGLAKDSRNIRIIAERENWTKQKKSKGKGFEYHISSLPQITQEALHKQAAIEAINLKMSGLEDSDAYQAGKSLAEEDLKQLKKANEDRLKRKQTGLKDFAALPNGVKKERAKARELVVQALLSYRREHPGTKSATRHIFVDLFNQGAIKVAPWALKQMPKRHGVRQLTEASLHRWEDDLFNKGIMGLVDNYGQSKGHGKIDSNPELNKIVLGAVFNNPHITAGKILDFIKADSPELACISKRSIQRYIKDWKEDNKQLWTYMTNPDLWKNVYMAAFGSHHENITRPNQLWEMDSTPADLMLIDGRYSVLGVIDMFTRRLKLLVSKTSKAEAVKQVFRRATLAWGVAESVRTDNGKDYVSNAFVTVLRDLEIEHLLCLPFASEQKGTIERALGTMSHGLPDLLPGFIGHNVSERKAIEARKSFAQRIMTPGEVVEVALTSEQLQEKLDKWADHVYAHNEHGGLNNKTPYQVATSWTGKLKRIADERALDALLYEPAGEPTVGKKGIRIDNQYYISPALASQLGNKVRVKRDERDVGLIYVYELEGGFICRAECHALRGTSPAEVATVTKKEQKKLMNAQRQEYKDHMRRMKVDMAETIMNHRIEQSENVTEFPQAFDDYSTPALEAAGEAARSGDGPQQSKDTIDMAAFQEQFRNTRPAPVVKMNDPREDYKRWARIEQRIHEGLSVDPADREGLVRYQQSSDYKSMKSHFEEFGLPIEDESSEVGLSG